MACKSLACLPGCSIVLICTYRLHGPACISIWNPSTLAHTVRPHDWSVGCSLKYYCTSYQQHKLKFSVLGTQPGEAFEVHGV